MFSLYAFDWIEFECNCYKCRHRLLLFNHCVQLNVERCNNLEYLFVFFTDTCGVIIIVHCAAFGDNELNVKFKRRVVRSTNQVKRACAQRRLKLGVCFYLLHFNILLQSTVYGNGTCFKNYFLLKTVMVIITANDGLVVH